MSTLVNAETGELVAECTPEEARVLTDRIKVGLEVTWVLVVKAYQHGAFTALGYSSWDDYCTREFGTNRIRLPREERSETITSLRAAGLSTRAIAAVIGIDDRTVRRDLSGAAIAAPDRQPGVFDMSDPTTREAVELMASIDEEEFVELIEAETPQPTVAVTATVVIGIDGKKYPQRPKPAVPAVPKRSPLPAAAGDAGWKLRQAAERIVRIAADDRFPTHRDQVATHLRSHLTYVIEVCQDLLDGLNQQPSED